MLHWSRRIATLCLLGHHTLQVPTLLPTHFTKGQSCVDVVPTRNWRMPSTTHVQTTICTITVHRHQFAPKYTVRVFVSNVMKILMVTIGGDKCCSCIYREDGYPVAAIHPETACRQRSHPRSFERCGRIQCEKRTSARSKSVIVAS